MIEGKSHCKRRKSKQPNLMNTELDWNGHGLHNSRNAHLSHHVSLSLSLIHWNRSRTVKNSGIKTGDHEMLKSSTLVIIETLLYFVNSYISCNIMRVVLRIQNISLTYKHTQIILKLYKHSQNEMYKKSPGGKLQLQFLLSFSNQDTK